MAWYALEEVDEAFEETKSLLLPFDLGTWARLALIVILTGQGVNLPNVPSSIPSGGTGDTSTVSGGPTGLETSLPAAIPTVAAPYAGPEIGTSVGPPEGLLIFGALVVLGIIVVLFLLSSVFEFIFYQSLIDKEVSIRDNWSQHFGKGLNYFGFRLAVLLTMGVLLVFGVASMFAQPLAGGLFLLVFVLVLIPVLIFLGLTKNFVLLKMMEEEKGVISAWREFYPEMKAEWEQVAVYILARFGLKIALGIIGFLWALIAGLLLLIPFGIVGFIGWMIAKWLLVVPVIILGVISWLVLLLGFGVPFQSFLYYYAILVYHDLTS